LEPFIAAEADFAKDGYHEAMLELGTFNGEVYGLPYSISLPVGYYNMDALRKAGVTELPTTWDELLKIAISSWKPAIKHQCGGVGA
jgi:multiple sugar transport system substrate-binding protein